MPELGDISYLRRRSCGLPKLLSVLSCNHLDEATLLNRPEGGWPHIISTAWKYVDKIDNVFALLHHIPYTRPAPNDNGVQDFAKGRLANFT